MDERLMKQIIIDGVKAGNGSILMNLLSMLLAEWQFRIKMLLLHKFLMNGLKTDA